MWTLQEDWKGQFHCMTSSGYHFYTLMFLTTELYKYRQGYDNFTTERVTTQHQDFKLPSRNKTVFKTDMNLYILILTIMQAWNFRMMK